jgi:hypothetical protein
MRPGAMFATQKVTKKTKNEGEREKKEGAGKTPTKVLGIKYSRHSNPPLCGECKLDK